jgi:nicotinate-nucleotide adenylyltransferase
MTEIEMLPGNGRVGVMGGTFDPPHNGHFRIAAAVASRKHLDRVIFIPASQPWQKSGYADAEDRLAMTVLGAASDARFAVSRIELDRKGPTYTIDTMVALAERFAGAEFFLILGADAAINLDTWHRIEDLGGLTHVVAVTRPGFDLSTLSLPAGAPEVEVLEVSPVDVSSTEIRAAVRRGEPIDDLVPRQVAEYIAEHHLYRDPPSPE